MSEDVLEFEDYYPQNTSVSLYNTNNVDFKHEPMFLGSGKNTQRFDDPKFTWYDESNDKMQGFDWKHNEVGLEKDAGQFKSILKNAEKYLTTRNFQKLIFLDSLQGRGPFLIFGQITTLPELENVILTWTYFEGAKHSRTYTEELRALYPNPGEIFEEAKTLPELLKISGSISKPYDDCYFHVINYIYKTQRNLKVSKKEMRLLKESIVMCWIEINILEGMRFYPAFASIWGITESQQLLQGTSENLQFICRDENEHLALTQFTLKLLKKDQKEGFTEVFASLADRIEDRYYEAYFEECDWIQYSFLEGSYVGMNAQILTQYLNYITIRRMLAVGIKPTKEKLGGLYIIKNPLPWINKYINMDKAEKLPQEENVTNYVTGGVAQDVIDDEDLECVQRLI